MIANMHAELLIKDRLPQTANSFLERVVWRVPLPVAGSEHHFKYRLALVVNGVCVIRYDNEAGKGDHKHIGNIEIPYAFSTPAQLLADFWQDVDNWRADHEHSNARADDSPRSGS